MFSLFILVSYSYPCSHPMLLGSWERSCLHMWCKWISAWILWSNVSAHDVDLISHLTSHQPGHSICCSPIPTPGLEEVEMHSTDTSWVLMNQIHKHLLGNTTEWSLMYWSISFTSWPSWTEGLLRPDMPSATAISNLLYSMRRCFSNHLMDLRHQQQLMFILRQRPLSFAYDLRTVVAIADLSLQEAMDRSRTYISPKFLIFGLKFLFLLSYAWWVLDIDNIYIIIQNQFYWQKKRGEPGDTNYLGLTSGAVFALAPPSYGTSDGRLRKWWEERKLRCLPYSSSSSTLFTSHSSYCRGVCVECSNLIKAFKFCNIGS